MILSLSSLLKLISNKLLSGLRTTNLGSGPIFIGLYFEAKNALKSLAFSLKSATSFLLTLNGEINGIFYN